MTLFQKILAYLFISKKLVSEIQDLVINWSNNNTKFSPDNIVINLKSRNLTHIPAQILLPYIYSVILNYKHVDLNPCEVKPTKLIKVVKADKYNRFVIPKQVLSFIGLEPKEKVFIKKDSINNTVVVSKYKEDEYFKERNVTSRGMIRLSASDFNISKSYEAKADTLSNKIYLQIIE